MTTEAVQQHSWLLREDFASKKWLRHYSKLVCVATICLIFAGALVTSHEAGLAVPDWPTTWGENMFLFPPSQWIGNIFYEHGHRLIASSVGMLTLLLAFWLWRAESRRWVKILGLLALAAVCVQGILGGITVLFLLPAAVSVSHAVLAQTFFVLTILIAYSQSCELEERLHTRPFHQYNSRFFKLSLALAALVYMQLVVGASMRHTGSGLAIPDFPTMGGELLPTFSAAALAVINDLRFELGLAKVEFWQVLIHFAHRVGGVVIALFAAIMFFKSLKDFGGHSGIQGMSHAILYLVIFQFLFGVLTVLTAKSPYVASFHVMLGAVLLGCAVLLALRAAPFGRSR